MFDVSITDIFSVLQNLTHPTVFLRFFHLVKLCHFAAASRTDTRPSTSKKLLFITGRPASQDSDEQSVMHGEPGTGVFIRNRSVIVIPGCRGEAIDNTFNHVVIAPPLVCE